MTLQVPNNNSLAHGTTYTCTADVRWNRSDTLETGFNSLARSSYQVYSVVPGEEPDFPFTSHTTPGKGALPITMDWLITLIPFIDSSEEGQSILATIFKVSEMSAWYTDQRTFGVQVSSAIAMLLLKACQALDTISMAEVNRFLCISHNASSAMRQRTPTSIQQYTNAPLLCLL